MKGLFRAGGPTRVTSGSPASPAGPEPAVERDDAGLFGLGVVALQGGRSRPSSGGRARIASGRRAPRPGRRRERRTDQGSTTTPTSDARDQ